MKPSQDIGRQFNIPITNHQQQRTNVSSKGILDDLGIHGWQKLEPVILASLATKSSLVLIGDHGTGKSMLLERLATAMSLNFRHYNASTINFDDLVGFPAPQDGRITYLRTPLDAWDAQAIFIDEISRCRIDMQNRLFPLIHEKKLQGHALHNLEYCWSAMNPPNGEYLGSNQLDPAFADRFHWLIHVPPVIDMLDQMKIIEGTSITSGASQRLQDIIRDIRSRMHLITCSFSKLLKPFVQALMGTLDRAGYPISLRRASIIYHNMLALLATGRFVDLNKMCETALTCSLPQNADKAPSYATITQAIKASKELLNIQLDPILKQLLIEKDPLHRIRISLKGKKEEIITATILDAHASLQYGKRLALSYHLFPILVEKHPHLPTIIFENLSIDMQQIQSLQRHVEQLPTYANRYKLADRITNLVSTLSAEEMWIEDILWTAYQANKITSIVEIIDFSRRVQHLFSSGG